ncbi:hypothetical protein DPMN_000180 [Dreissena polymorpha]|uniref:Uncharacterized protein n=1 Tax=Dreissena polymorpha TaxID=45954 RepID=A0A9D4MHN5_DREPO|nr:hypothetical protein DPMN_000180 [Dreissena polymorpha]
MSGRGKPARRKRKAQTKLPENHELRGKRPSPPLLPGGHVFLPIQTIFELNFRIQETNVLTEFYEDWGKNVSSRLFICFHYVSIVKTSPNPWRPYIYKIDAKNVTSREKMTPPPLVAMFFLPIRTIFELNRHIQKTPVLTKFHEDWTKNMTSRVKNCPALWRPYINKTNVLTKFHDDWAKIVTSRVFTRNNAPPPPPWRPCFSMDQTIFQLNQHII